MTIFDLLANPAATAAVASVVGALAGILVARTKKAPDVQSAIASATEKIIGHYSRASTAPIAQAVVRVANAPT